MDFLNQFWDAAVFIDPNAGALHEGARFPDANAEGLKALFDKDGFTETNTAPIEIETRFKNFDDYWQPFLGGQGPAPRTYFLWPMLIGGRSRTCF